MKLFQIIQTRQGRSIQEEIVEAWKLLVKFGIDPKASATDFIQGVFMIEDKDERLALHELTKAGFSVVAN